MGEWGYGLWNRHLKLSLVVLLIQTFNIHHLFHNFLSAMSKTLAIMVCHNVLLLVSFHNSSTWCWIPFSSHLMSMHVTLFLPLSLFPSILLLPSSPDLFFALHDQKSHPYIAHNSFLIIPAPLNASKFSLYGSKESSSFSWETRLYNFPDVWWKTIDVSDVTLQFPYINTE